jgi:hypothetical protein
VGGWCTHVSLGDARLGSAGGQPPPSAASCCRARCSLRQQLEAAASRLGERVLVTPGNPISLAMTLDGLAAAAAAAAAAQDSSSADGNPDTKASSRQGQRQADVGFFGAMLWARWVGLRANQGRTVGIRCWLRGALCDATADTRDTPTHRTPQECVGHARAGSRQAADRGGHRF